MASRSRRTFSREVCLIVCASSSKGAGNAGRSMRPIAACALVTNKLTRVSQVTPESPGIPHAMVYGLLRALPGAPGFLATVACATSRRLDTSVGVSGPHAFSVRFRAVRHRHYQRPPHPDPRFVTLRNAPLWDGTAGNIEVIWVFRKTEYFCKRGLTAGLENGPSGKSKCPSGSGPDLIAARSK
jgi:hypothetical protein